MILKALLAVLLGAALVWVMQAQDRKPAPGTDTEALPSRADLEAMFKDLQDQGWKPEGELLWAYFFKDADPKELVRLGGVLEKQGYTVVDIYRENPQIAMFTLMVQKPEKHTVESLLRRNEEFVKLAAAEKVRSYVGIDVFQPEDVKDAKAAKGKPKAK